MLTTNTLDLSSTPSQKVEPFSLRLLAWFDQHGRKDLPWQHNKTPYRVWLSEIMLQQTQVATVIPYFETFMSKYPSVDDLANAELDNVLHLWTGLGYYARCRNLHKCAKIVANEHEGLFPETLEGLNNLPGIGPSTAAAICSIAYGQPTAIMDGNVKRVLSRYHAIAGWPGKPTIEKQLWAHAHAHMPQARCADYTQAIMDFGATLCTRSKPNCANCPMKSDCAALLSGDPSQFPEKKPRKTLPTKTVFMAILKSQKGIFLEQRPATGIWGGLWSLPEFESEESLQQWALANLKLHKDMKRLTPFRHTFSHYHLDIHPALIETNKNCTQIGENASLWYSTQQIGLAAPVKKLLKSINETAK